MLSRKCFIVACFSFITTAFIYAQHEGLTNLSFNPVVAKESYIIKNNSVSYKTTAVILPDTISLPFKDDFSKNSVFPDTAWWLDKYVFINRDYPIAPPTLGVATFDGLNQYGLPYDWSAQPGSSAPADTLTSRVIDLTYPASDSIYLSFFYQAQGRGLPPQPGDSIVLELQAPDTAWTQFWSKDGYTPGQGDTSFHLVMIPITNGAYLTKGFQLRFRNYGCLAGNLDLWHIDYVYLNNHRSWNDTVFDDVAFVYNAPSLLKNYKAMPWEQYDSTEMANNITIKIRNNDNNAKNTSYGFDVRQIATASALFTYSGGSENVNPFLQLGYDTVTPQKNPQFNFKFPQLADTSTYIIEHVLNTAPDLDYWNDTIRYSQKFYDYYAYDDGTAEVGYFQSEPSASVAYKFSLNKADTIRAISIFFDPILYNASEVGEEQVAFFFRVWADSSGFPGHLLYQSDSVQYPIYTASYNAFQNYLVNSGAGLALNAGPFYIGYYQISCIASNESTCNMTVGFDLNTNSQTKTFFKSTETDVWEHSGEAGSLMIRPVFKKILFEGIESFNAIQETKYQLYPNPAQNTVYIKSIPLNNEHLSIHILDACGKVITEKSTYSDEPIDISNLASGFYFMTIAEKPLNTYTTNKLIIAR